MLPDTNILDLPNVFDQFFDNKISNILSKLPPCRPDPTPTQTKHSFSSFSIPSITTIIKFLNASQSSSATDPLPLTLITLFSPQLANKLLPIFSHSLTTGIVPKSFKCAIITPIIKKPSLDPSELNHYRPISNLSIFSKTLERIVSTQLTNYLSTNNILNKYQSAFCPDKSCETTITSLTSNILPTLDKLGTLVVLLDLSAAFDTLNHSILVNRLASIGITAHCLDWFKSFISHRTYRVKIKDNYSTPRTITTGVPQGSVLGPMLFNIYLIPLFDIIINHPLITIHTYADDIQLNVKCTSDPGYAPRLITACINDIHLWLSSNSLSLNPNKTECIHLHLPSISTSPSLPHVQANHIDIPYTKCIKYLGIFFDSNISLHRHISHLLQQVHFHTHSLRLVRNSIPLSTAIIIASSFILPHFDYCNSILLNLPDYQINRLQLAQNSVARCIFKMDRFSRMSIKSKLKDLHWLPIKYRIIFKNLLLLHNAYIHGKPDYLAELIYPLPSRTIRLRSTNTHQLQLPDKFKLHSTNIRAWSISIPYYWNNLPLVIRSATVTSTFKSLLKTHLFQQAYPAMS